MMIYDDDVAYSSSHAEDLLYLPMNRTVRRRSVAVPWSLFPRARLARFFLFLFCGEGIDCRTRAVVCASSPQGQRADYNVNLFHVASQSTVACS